MATKTKKTKKTTKKKVAKKAAAKKTAARKTSKKAAPRLTVVTLGVQDLARARAFYEKLGFAVSSASNESIVFMDAGGAVLALYRRKMLADDANMTSEGSGFGGVTLARNVASKAEVDAALAAAKEAGASILKPAHEAFWGGYSGYYADPDGHPWEVAHNPFWKLDRDGRVQMPK